MIYDKKLTLIRLIKESQDKLRDIEHPNKEQIKNNLKKAMKILINDNE